MSDAETPTKAADPKVLLAHHLKKLKLPTVLAEYERQARTCAEEGVDHPRYLLRLAERELIERKRKMVERRVWAAKFPASKSLDSFDFKLSTPSLNKVLVTELARSAFIIHRDNIIALGPSGTGKTYLAIRLGLGWPLVTSNLPFEDWTSVFGSERLTGALLDRLTHHVNILEMNGDSYRLKQSQARRQA